ncbi:zinc finger CCCH domain-containing protein 67 [Alnus glutinosa]|uniref:zinc finger CCCH domain-containing protein 67 n=1 Tax=Alnus glutinosa TaxID=3517 RepID=UPI002D7696B1|nr:zinc finger CCCH domain-containing protein 67 [Alnus glutinosa]
MEASESTCVPNPNNENSELEFQTSNSPNSDLDHAPSDDPNRTAEDHTVALHEELQKLDLKEESETVSKEEAEKDGNWDLKEVEQEQWVEKEKGDSNWEEEKGGESGWDDWNVNVNGNEIEIEKVVVEEVLTIPGVPDVEVEESGERNDNGNANANANAKRHQYQYPVRPEAEDCAFYLKTGTCKFASNCKFNHPVRRKNQAVKEKVKEREDSTERPGQTECKYHLRSGGCKYGKDCRYNHTRGKTSGTTILELNFLGLPIRLGEKECPYYMRTGSCKYGANCRFNHPDPTVVGGSDTPSGYGNGGSAPLGASPSSIASWSSHTLNETAPFVPMVLPPASVVPPHNRDWNGYQVPVYPSERSMHPPAPFVMNPAATETNVFTHHHQQVQVDEYPERPGQPECSYYLKTGDCKFKSNCKYHHPKDRAARSPPCALSDKGLPLRPDQSICSHYSRYGICKYGPACRFNHPILPASLPMPGVDQLPSYGNSATTDEAGVAGSGGDATFQQPL